VGFELPDISGAADAARALSDMKFGGRYDVGLKFGYALEREKVNLPLPRTSDHSRKASRVYQPMRCHQWSQSRAAVMIATDL
jgi:hypothetical protein